MILALPRDVRDRLARIEAVEGIPALDLVHQAVDVWSRLDADGRRMLGVVAMQLVVDQLRGGRP